MHRCLGHATVRPATGKDITVCVACSGSHIPKMNASSASIRIRQDRIVSAHVIATCT